MKGKSFSKKQHSFAVAQPSVNRERSTFSRPSRTTTAIDAAYIYPMLVDEILPGDTFNLKMKFFGRLATPLTPFMDNIYVDSFMFFIPHRLVWDNWERFQGAKDNPGDTTVYQIPEMEIAGGPTTGADLLADYFGLPTQALLLKVSALPFRAYNLVYNEFFRDQNIQDSVVVDKDDADSTESDYVLLKRGKRKDYLTGALPWPQRGESVQLSLGSRADIVGIGTTDADNYATGTIRMTGGVTESSQQVAGVTAATLRIEEDPLNLGFPDVYADLSTATASTVNQLRLSIAIQQVLELDARTGARYVEALKARWGVTSPDFRLQRPEYLGGGTTNISVVPVPNTSQAQSGIIGTLSGYGVVAGEHGFTHSFTEHGTLLIMLSIRADHMYYQGVQRMWSRSTRYDFFEPAFAHLGEQPIYNREVFADASANDALVFGYAERFSEYKYGNSICTSIMRPNAPGSLSKWNLAQVFSGLPTLSDAFIVEDPPIDRVIATPTEPHFLMDCFFENNTTRVMPVFNTPGLTRL